MVLGLTWASYILWTLLPIILGAISYLAYSLYQKYTRYKFIGRHVEVIVNWSDTLEEDNIEENTDMESTLVNVLLDDMEQVLGRVNRDNYLVVVARAIRAEFRRRETTLSAINGNLLFESDEVECIDADY